MRRLPLLHLRPRSLGLPEGNRPGEIVVVVGMTAIHCLRLHPKGRQTRHHPVGIGVDDRPKSARFQAEAGMTQIGNCNLVHLSNSFLQHVTHILFQNCKAGLSMQAQRPRKNALCPCWDRGRKKRGTTSDSSPRRGGLLLVFTNRGCNGPTRPALLRLQAGRSGRYFAGAACLLAPTGSSLKAGCLGTSSLHRACILFWVS